MTHWIQSWQQFPDVYPSVFVCVLVMANSAEQLGCPQRGSVIHLSSSRFPPGHWSDALMQPDTCLVGWPATGLTRTAPPFEHYASMHKHTVALGPFTQSGGGGGVHACGQTWRLKKTWMCTYSLRGKCMQDTDIPVALFFFLLSQRIHIVVQRLKSKRIRTPLCFPRENAPRCA